jgi:hypothetical protein
MCQCASGFGTGHTATVGTTNKGGSHCGHCH